MSEFGKYGVYVMQDDSLFAYLTVKECLWFATKLRLSGLTSKEMGARISGVVKDLSLQKCLDTKASKISGGERKRTSIAIELLSNPSLVLLDEPTSSLDSFKALQVIRILSRLAKAKNLAIIATIH